MKILEGKIKVKGTSLWKVKENVEGGKEYDIPNTFKVLLSKEEHKNKPCTFYFDKDNKLVLDTVDGKPIAENEQVVALQAEQAAQREKKAQTKMWTEKLEEAKRQQVQKKDNEEYNLKDAYLPKDTCDLLSVALLEGKEIDNFSLKLQKTANFPKHNESATIYKKNRGSTLQYSAQFDVIPFEEINQRLHQSTLRHFNEESKVKSFKMTTSTKMIIGIGGASVYEVGLTLHHIYGIPYIPASAIKGLTRSWVIQNNYANNEGKALEDKNFCDIFGCPAEWKGSDKVVYKSFYEKNKEEFKLPGERIGSLVFFDAFPVTPPKIEPDIMNVHYPDYYKAGGNKPPTDHQKLKPISFLTVSKGTTFQFILGVRKSNGEQDEQLLIKTQKTLKEALSENGIGAKTAVGYGYMEAEE